MLSTGRAPSSAPCEPAPSAAEPPYERVDLDRYVVQYHGPIGFVEVVPPVFVCYLGHPYSAAVEVAQVHDFGRAVDTVVAAHRQEGQRG